MKKHLLVFISLICFATLFAQTEKKEDEKFNILSFGSVKNVGFYVKAINGADLENWRLQEKRTRLKFDTGFEIELLSASELKKKGFNVDVSSYKKEFPPLYNMPLFNVFPDGKLGAAITPTNKEDQRK